MHEVGFNAVSGTTSIVTTNPIWITLSLVAIVAIFAAIFVFYPRKKGVEVPQ
jgi:hypothetical protein